MGTMRERSPGSWELTVSAGVDPSTGRYARVIRTVRTSTKREAKAALRRLEVEVASGQVGLGGPDGRRVARAMAGPSAGPRPISRPRSTAIAGTSTGSWSRPSARVRLSKLTAGHLDRLYSSLRRRGLAPATIRQIHAIVRAALHQAVRWGLVSRNVASLASAPSQPQREQQPPTVDEVRALIDAAEATEPMFGLYVRLVAATGMRRSEACGLRWSDIDLETGRLIVQRSHLSLPGSVGDQPTKTRSVRTVTLDPDTIGTLRSAWRAARQLAASPGWTMTAAGPGTCSAMTPTVPGVAR